MTRKVVGLLLIGAACVLAFLMASVWWPDEIPGEEVLWPGWGQATVLVVITALLAAGAYVWSARRWPPWTRDEPHDHDPHR